MRIRRLMVAATLTLLAALAVASPASADPGDGAEVDKRRDCVTRAFGTVCFDSMAVVNRTETPSGNVSYIVHVRASDETTLASGCHQSGSFDLRSHYLVKDGTLHERGQRSALEFNFECEGITYRCAYAVHVHYANGEFQFLRPEVDCP